MLDITQRVKDFVRKCNVSEGMCFLHCPHTTAGLTINENADPDVVSDILLGLERMAPNLREFRHSEGNSDAHIKSSLTGCGLSLLVEDGGIVLGRWQGIYFCEFDGPRTRSFYAKITGEQVGRMPS